MNTNSLMAYCLSIVPGLGHIAIEQRKKGYSFIFIDIILFAMIYLAGMMFLDYTFFVRLIVAILGLVAPLYLWAYTDLAQEIAAANKQ
ncbi:MAG: hypothetical protein ABIH39_07365 [Candidatus Margulisiibacteriota bacterium]